MTPDDRITVPDWRKRLKKQPRIKNAKRTEYKSPLCGTRTYASMAEAEYAAQLDEEYSFNDDPPGRVADEIVMFWLPQVPFPLPGGVTYRVDFMEYRCLKSDTGSHWVDLVDVKGHLTDVSRLKIKMVEDIYGVNIQLVKAGPLSRAWKKRVKLEAPK